MGKDQHLKVNVFLARERGQKILLAMPINPQSVIPYQYKVDWLFYASISTGDRIFSNATALNLEKQIDEKGYAILETTIE